MEDEAVRPHRLRFAGLDQGVERRPQAEETVEGARGGAANRSREEGLGQRRAGEMRPVKRKRPVTQPSKVDREPFGAGPVVDEPGRHTDPRHPERVRARGRAEIVGGEVNAVSRRDLKRFLDEGLGPLVAGQPVLKIGLGGQQRLEARDGVGSLRVVHARVIACGSGSRR